MFDKTNQFERKGTMNRRDFARLAGGFAGALTLGKAPLLAQKGGKGTVVRNTLKIPVTETPTIYPLGAAPASVDMGGGKMGSALAYNGNFPGPTFRATSGSDVSVTLQNYLSKETTVHWHGMIVPPEADGHPMDAVMPDGNYLYKYKINQRACLNWYHPHPHMMTGEQVALGLAGAFIINDSEEAALNLPSGAYEVPLILRDANFDKAGNLIYNSTSSGFLGKVPLVNGTIDPTLNVDTAIYRFRVLNGANARVFKLALGNGAAFTVIGNDGGLLASAAQASQIEFGPGERLDLLVDFRYATVGSKIMLRDVAAGWDLLEFDVTGQNAGNGVLPKESATLSTIAPLGTPTTTRTFRFEGMSKINGKVFDMHRIDFEVPAGQTELWRFTTGRNAPHPIHVHGASFQVVSRSGGRGVLYPWEGGWKDTVLLQDAETVEVLINFSIRGLFLLHCHKLEHEDMGMMSNFVVV
jgi:blue copper oxidase